MNHTPTLKSHTLTLRAITQHDTNDLFEIYGDTRVMEFASDPTFTTISMVKQMMESVNKLKASGESYEWAIVENQSRKVIGTCGIHSFSECGTVCEVGCLLNASFWRKGIMSDALLMLFRHAKNLGISSLLADINKDNTRSIDLFVKLGFNQAGGVYKLDFNSGH
ncbi:GNAT family N-acetyltransferase [Vibrio penaeicida]|uniref:GNAT family N-acetyltransferase n=1 Tax=Vibrio penaeicida TaxID=104609 RepID=UPI0027324C13|nr:GNAT family N-acetyltransferase [Vibrio penaeicida]MDP2571711.1 GNAT family N-acetyltransferase [Vibrio penaeicida]